MTVPQPPQVPLQSGPGTPSYGHVPPPTGNLTFSEWYCMKFSWFTEQPMPWKIFSQIPLWGFYGYIWIPIWFFLSDRRRNQGPMVLTPQNLHHHVNHNPQPTTGAMPVPPATPSIPVPVTTPQAVVPPVPRAAVQSSTPVLDLNSADEKELAALPGIGPILAKKLVAGRKANGPYQSLEQVSEFLGLKPHIVSQLNQRVVVQLPPPSPTTVANRSGRVIDF